ncbi:hypothetical protein [Vibrio phage LV6]|nr:hypothetical protein [Vibrio phage LV6]
MKDQTYLQVLHAVAQDYRDQLNWSNPSNAHEHRDDLYVVAYNGHTEGLLTPVKSGRDVGTFNYSGTILTAKRCTLLEARRIAQQSVQEAREHAPAYPCTFEVVSVLDIALRINERVPKLLTSVELMLARYKG